MRITNRDNYKLMKLRTFRRRIAAASMAAAILSALVPVEALAAPDSVSAASAAQANLAYEQRLAQAASENAAVPQTIKDLFNPFFYALQYPDAALEAGTDIESLYQHFLTKGIYNGYRCNSYFDIKKYRDDHPELASYLGDDWDMWVAYFFMGQNAPGSLRASFDPVFYAAAYPDAALQCGNDPEALYHHYITFGLNMGYAGNAYFNLYKYRAAHPAFGSLYGNDWEAWLRGFYTTGLTGGGKPDYKRNDELKALTEARGYDSSDSSDSFDGNSISDGNGNVLIPVSEIGRYLTLDELRERCGDSLILVTDAEGYVTFVGGHFTDVQVSDDHDSEKAIECMLKLIGFPEGQILKFSRSVTNSMGHVYYQFTEADQGGTRNNYLSVISLGTDDSGKVISLSSNCNAKLSEEDKAEAKVIMDDILKKLEKNNETLLTTGFETVSIPYQNAYCKVFYGKDKNGHVSKYIINPGGNYIYNIGKYSDIPTEENGLYAYDYLFADAVETEAIRFKDYFNNDVTLSVATMKKGEKTYYYLVDKDRRIAANLKEAHENDDLTKGFDSLDDIHSYYVQSFVTIQKSYDYYKKLGFFDDDKVTPIIVRFDEDDTSDNAFCCHYGDYIEVDISNNTGNAAFDGVSHELGHGILFGMAPVTNYVKDGSFHEGYADISGNILEMLLFLAGDPTTGQTVDLDKWSIEESVGVDTTIRSMGDPESMEGASKVGGKNYLVTHRDGENCHAHATIYGNICYRMKKELDIPLDDLLRIWYDALPNITGSSTYKDIQSFVAYSTRLHGYEELADDVSKLFDDANADGYSDKWTELKAADDYVTDIPVIIDDYGDIFGDYFKSTYNNIYLSIAGVENGTEASVDKYGNLGAILEKGSSLPQYDRLNIYYNENIYSYPFKVPTDSQVHIDSKDVISALNSMCELEYSVDGLSELDYDLELSTDDYCDYYIYRVDDENKDYVPIYIPLKAYPEHTPLKLRSDSRYELCKYNYENEKVIVGSIDTADIRDKSNAKITLSVDETKDSGVDVTLEFSDTDNAENVQNPAEPDHNTGRALAARANVSVERSKAAVTEGDAETAANSEVVVDDSNDVNTNTVGETTIAVSEVNDDTDIVDSGDDDVSDVNKNAVGETTIAESNVNDDTDIVDSGDDDVSDVNEGAVGDTTVDSSVENAGNDDMINDVRDEKDSGIAVNDDVVNEEAVGGKDEVACDVDGTVNSGDETAVFDDSLTDLDS
ncbi:hypothetical protein [Oribacterium sp. NK2B42]|uniref:hypothetical protein n=1 Tax=Oribacterium sp. NK2B42 TaxID=689781 RepID=UPI000492E3C6|nr:hypothetical protein [Oribacterium sp. NK2B42]